MRRWAIRETRAEQTVLCTYVENHAILELFSPVHQNINKRKDRATKTVIGLPFFLPV